MEYTQTRQWRVKIDGKTKGEIKQNEFYSKFNYAAQVEVQKCVCESEIGCASFSLAFNFIFRKRMDAREEFRWAKNVCKNFE